ncbi:MAG: hypothetical protein J07HX5_01307 [halophilic archaeon J07HX5]|jgi:hypothetical protein|nr:MAG: hypothetical protein J07HX5_01307 [halophilic archaeon J07HX5]
MNRLAPQHIPLYSSADERDTVWQRCIDDGQPVVAIRDARRGHIVRYDLSHLRVELTPDAVRKLRAGTRSFRSYPTINATDAEEPIGTDPLSAAEGVGGEAGPVSGALHTDSESAARELAVRVSGVLFDASNRR